MASIPPTDARARPGPAAGRGEAFRADTAAAATIVAAGVVIAWPVLAGGYLTYLDNPPHLAEIYAAAFESRNGWSEIAFCGFPLGSLHSPLWYGAVSWLVRAGLSAPPLYAACLVLGLLAPSLALYYVARRTLSPLPAALLAYLLLVQRPALVGIGSALGGMWTFYVATAALILLIDRLVRPIATIRDLARVAGLVGAIVVTHLYAVVPLVLLGFLHFWIAMGRRRADRLGWPWQLVAAAVGVGAAGVYWIPMALARDHLVIIPQNLSAGMVLARLAMPTHVFDLVNHRPPALTVTTLVESIPMLLLILAGAAGVVMLRRRRDDAPLYGAVLAAALLIVLLFVTGEFDTKALGPGSWRMLYFVRTGLALSAMPLVSLALRRRPRQRYLAPTVAVAAVCAVALGWWFGRPLRAVVPTVEGHEVAEVEELWEWLRENRRDDWGRVYLQDTFELPRQDARLSQSHILALTSYRTGVRQVGATYGVAPYRTAFWTPSEFGTLFRKFVRDEDSVRDTRGFMLWANVTHLVLSDARTRQKLAEAAGFEEIHRTERFAVVRTPFESEWVRPADEGVAITSVEFETGRIRFAARADRSGGQILVKSSAHPGWRLTAPAGAQLRAERTGLMVLEGYPQGEFDVELGFRPDRRPKWLSLLCWTLIGAALAAGGRRGAGIFAVATVGTES